MNHCIYDKQNTVISSSRKDIGLSEEYRYLPANIALYLVVRLMATGKRWRHQQWSKWSVVLSDMDMEIGENIPELFN